MKNQEIAFWMRYKLWLELQIMNNEKILGIHKTFHEFYDLFMTLKVHRITNTELKLTSSGIFNTYSSRAVDCARLFLSPLKINNSKVAEK